MAFCFLFVNHCAVVFVVQVKADVRRLKGIPALVSMLDNPNKEVSLLIFSMILWSFFAEVCLD